MTNSLSALIGWVAVSLGVFGTIAQYRRVQTQGVEGISIATWTLFLWLSAFWISYGAAGAHSWQVIMGSAIIAPLQVVIYFRLAPWRRAREVYASTLFMLASVGVPMMFLGWRGGVLGTSVTMTITRFPQIRELLVKEDASGVSAASWWFGVVGCALWLGYYGPQRLWSAFIATFFAMSANIVVVALVHWRHYQAHQRLIAEEVFASDPVFPAV